MHAVSLRGPASGEQATTVLRICDCSPDAPDWMLLTSACKVLTTVLQGQLFKAKFTINEGVQADRKGCCITTVECRMLVEHVRETYQDFEVEAQFSEHLLFNVG